MSLPVLLGMLGVAINLIAYGLLSVGRLRASDARYQLINVVGTTGLLISLSVQWNFASFILNIAWLSIGLFCLARIYLKRRTA